MKVLIESISQFDESNSEIEIKYITFKKTDFEMIRTLVNKSKIWANSYGDIYRLTGYVNYSINDYTNYTVSCWEREKSEIVTITGPDIKMDLSGNLTVECINDYIYIS